MTTARDGPTGLDVALHYDFEVLILDIMLPGMNGFEIARRLRGARRQVPIVMMTARDADPDIVQGLDLGADDYLTKPFSFEVLLARVRALARRGPVARPILLQVADLVLNPASREVSWGGVPVNLTRTECGLLEFLMRYSGQVISRTTLIEAVWGFEREIESDTLEAFIRLLRNKIDAGRRTRLIHTVRGVGYPLREEKGKGRTRRAYGICQKSVLGWRSPENHPRRAGQSQVSRGRCTRNVLPWPGQLSI